MQDLRVANEGFGRNAQAKTPYPQYIIYLDRPHLNEQHGELADRIETAWPDFIVDEFQQISYRKGIKYSAELWCFVHLKKDDLNFRNN